ncbi:dipeptidyl-peptidase 3 [Microsporum canis CBS 113480]|uniref:Dipeptidyl peptidase 3 n=1 Tax=Arthroderma otae (strain ATCC MYA-4605 / CBS 113480) TaxID=554155 RepID=C5FF66_ARTOC|nr:dipeptidyl-peptidase 3 [Microsporum canis CBS 113480]EEQ28450.1 dipeptidyl-peptidase 3 [Microsporum canis CBS 113480]
MTPLRRSCSRAPSSSFSSFFPRLLRHQLPKSSSSPRAASTSLYRQFSSTRSLNSEAMDIQTKHQYLADSPPTIVRLEIRPHFEALKDDKLKRYSHFISRAAFQGTRITLRQVSPESEPIYDLIISLYNTCKGDWKALATKTNTSPENLQFFLEYAAQFLGNCGNYKGFGDSKFIPRIPSDAFEALASGSPETKKLFDLACKSGGGIYETASPDLMHLGYPEKGQMTTYYPDSPSITKEEITLIGDFLEKKQLLLENTRLRKTQDGNFELLIASAETSPAGKDRDVGDVDGWDLEGKLAGKKLKLVYGDYSEIMKKIAESIKQAGANAANDIQKKMHQEYFKSFTTGSIEAYKESQRYWIRDIGPMVESDIGFVETYRDPHGVRGEWEGFAAMVNLERTKAFSKLVENAETMIPKLPWGKEFEKQTFLSPDFTSLEVMSFAGSGIPAGINIPNYDDIRQNLGFKNVSLGNVLSAKAPNEPVPFIRAQDLSLFREHRDAAFEVQVGIHELLGHGTGKLLQETSPGKYNFDVSNPPVSPIDGKPISTWYKPGQTWSSVFGSIASSYEECRAECVAMALGCDFGILQLFGFGNGKDDIDGQAGDVLYASYLQMARAGVVALEFWDPSSKKWGQAHMQARFSILRTFLGAGDDFVRLVHEKEDLSDLEIHLDRSKILSHGRPAVEKYLQKLHVYKSTANFEAGKALYDESTHVDEWWGTKVRPIVLQKKVPRKVFVQANTVLEGDKVVLKEYEPTLEGMIQSYAERDV